MNKSFVYNRLSGIVFSELLGIDGSDGTAFGGFAEFFVSKNGDFNPPVLLATRYTGIVGNRLAFAIPFFGYPVTFNAFGLQNTGNGSGPTLRKFLIVGI